MRLRSNFTWGVIDNNPLSASDTILTSDTLDLPDLDAGGTDYYALTLDPAEENGDLEVVYVIEHDKGGATPSDTATIVRAKEGTSERLHPLGTKFVHGPTKLDAINQRIEWPIDFPKHTADTPDDDFEGDTLDGKWTVEDGSSGTNDDILQFPTKDNYQVDDGLWSMCSNDTATTINQAYTLAVGESIVAKIIPNCNVDGTGGPDSGSGRFYFGLQDNNTAHRTTNYMEFNGYMNVEDSVLRTYVNGASGGYTEGAGDNAWQMSAPCYARWLRVSGTAYQPSWSVDGRTWLPFPEEDLTATMTHIYLRLNSAETSANLPTPMLMCDWVRLGGADQAPW